jgi:hypothetical protein
MHVMTSCGMTAINKTGGFSVVHTAHSHAALLTCQGDLNPVRAVAFGRTSSRYRQRTSVVHAIFRFWASHWFAMIFCSSFIAFQVGLAAFGIHKFQHIKDIRSGN